MATEDYLNDSYITGDSSMTWTPLKEPTLLEAAMDALESLRRLPDVDGAYRVTCIHQLERAIYGMRVTADEQKEPA